MSTPTINSLILAGTDYCELNDFTNAYTCFNKALQIDNASNEALFGRGVCLLKTNRTTEGLADIRNAAKLGNTYAIEFLKTSPNGQDTFLTNKPTLEHPDYSSKYYGIKGWLAFLCVVLVLSPLLSLGNFGQANDHFTELVIKYKQLAENITPDNPSFLKTQIAILSLIKAKNITSTFLYFSYALLFMGITSVIYIYKRDKRGIVFAKAYVISSIIISLTYPFFLYKALNIGIGAFMNTSGVQFILSLSAGIAWLLYLNKSKRIKATFGA